MSASTSLPQTARRGRSRRLVLISVLAAVIAAIASAVATYAVGSGSSPARPNASIPASVLSHLTPQQRQYVQAIASMSYAEMAAAFGTGR